MWDYCEVFDGLGLCVDEQGGEGRECLAHQLVTVLQQMAQRSCITEVSTQTSPATEGCKHATRTSCTSPKDLGNHTSEWEQLHFSFSALFNTQNESSTILMKKMQLSVPQVCKFTVRVMVLDTKSLISCAVIRS